MRTTLAIASLLAAAACVSASHPAPPVLAFTSQQQPSMQFEPPADASVSSFVDSLLVSGKKSPACSIDAFAVVSVKNLDGDAFAGLRHSPTHSLRARALGAAEQITFNAYPEADVMGKVVKRITEACGHNKYHITSPKPAERFHHLKGAPHMLDISVDDLRNQEADLLQTLESIHEAYPNNLVLIVPDADETLHQHSKRQVAASPSSSDGKWAEPTGGIFARYQLFSTPLLLVLLLVGGVLVPIVYFAVAQLAQVQTPDQMGVRKDPISGEKKSQ